MISKPGEIQMTRNFVLELLAVYIVDIGRSRVAFSVVSTAWRFVRINLLLSTAESLLHSIALLFFEHFARAFLGDSLRNELG